MRSGSTNRSTDLLTSSLGCRRKAVKMATIQEKIRENKIVSCKFKSCLGRDENGKQIFKCYTWYPPVGLTKAKCRKEAERAAAVWEAEIKQAYALQKEQEAEAGSAKV